MTNHTLDTSVNAPLPPTPAQDNEAFARRVLPQCMAAARQAALAGATAGAIAVDRYADHCLIRFVPAQALRTWSEPEIADRALAWLPNSSLALAWLPNSSLAFPELGLVIIVSSDAGAGVYLIMPPPRLCPPHCRVAH